MEKKDTLKKIKFYDIFSFHNSILVCWLCVSGFPSVAATVSTTVPQRALLIRECRTEHVSVMPMVFFHTAKPSHFWFFLSWEVFVMYSGWTHQDQATIANQQQSYTLKDISKITGKSCNLIYRRLTETPTKYLVRFARREGERWVFDKKIVDDAIKAGTSLIVRANSPTAIDPTDALRRFSGRPRPGGKVEPYGKG